MAYFSRSAFAQRRVAAQVNHETLCPVCDSGDSSYVLSRNEMRLLRCQGCNLIRLEPRKSLSARAVGQGANTMRARAQATRVEAPTDWLRILEAIRHRIRQCGTVAEIAHVGLIGSLSAEVQALAATLGLRVHPIDPATLAASAVPPAIDVSATELAIPRLFDACLIAEPLERNGDPLSTLVMVRRLLAAPDGVLAITLETLLPDSHSLQAQDLIASPGTRFLYNRETAESLLFRAGFGRIQLPPPAPGSKAVTVVTAAMRYPEDPMRRRGKLSVIMPVFNEKATFLDVFELLHAKELRDFDKEIIVVESNSTDGTKDDVQSIAGRAGVQVVWEERPRGKGHAVRQGLQRASGDFILIQDADLEYDIEDYDILLDPLFRNRAAFVLGVRHGHHGDSWKMRHFEGQFIVSQLMNLAHLFFTTLFNVVYHQRLTDPFTMFKVFRRDCIDGVTFECNRFDFDWELVAKLVRRGYEPVEIPVNYVSRSFMEGKKVAFFRDPLTWLRACIKYRFVKV